MLTPETALQKIKQLSPEQQKQVFQLIETLEKKANNPDETPTEEAMPTASYAIAFQTINIK